MTELSRRSVLKSDLLTAVSADTVVGTTEAKAATPTRTETFDVVVIGCGCAGMAAAIEAKRQGYTACIVDKMSRPAGNTIYSGGIINATGKPCGGKTPWHQRP